MEQFFTKRDYVRTAMFKVSARVSRDAEQWSEIHVPNIAAGGMLFITEMEVPKGEVLWFHLNIDTKIVSMGESVKVNMRLQAEVMSDRGLQEDMHAYAARFVKISNEDQIRLDELVRLAIAKYGSI